MSQFVTAPMARLVVAGTRSELPDVLEATSRLRAVHLIDHDGRAGGLELGRPLDGADDTSRRLTRLRTAVSHLSPAGPDARLAAPQVRAELDDRMPALVEEVLVGSHERDQLAQEVAQLEQTIETLEALEPLGVDLELLGKYEHLEVRVGRVATLDRMRSELLALGEGVLEISSQVAGGVLAVFARVDRMEAVQRALSSEGFEPLTVPALSGGVGAAITTLRAELADVHGRLSSLEAQLATRREEDGALLLGGMELLERDHAVRTAPVRLAMSERAFVLDGWVEQSRVAEVEAALEPLASHIEIEPIPLAGAGGHTHDEDAAGATAPVPPTAFSPRIAARPMELVTDLVGRPRYGRIDPTSFILITYPIFFGMMLGDAAFGLMTVGLGWWIGRSPMLRQAFGEDLQRQASRLILYIGVATIIFGFWYAEFLGFEITGEGEHGAPVWISWMSFLYPAMEHGHGPHIELPFNVLLAYPMHRVSTNMLDLMVITIDLGVLHLLLGYIIGFLDVRRDHGVGAAFFEKGSWIIVLLGGFLFVHGFMVGGVLYPAAGAGWTDQQVLALVILGVGVPSLMWGLWNYEGFGVVGAPLALLECVGLLSNVLSYMRLFAIGVAGVKIAEIGNVMGYAVMEQEFHGALEWFALALAPVVLWVALLFVPARLLPAAASWSVVRWGGLVAAAAVSVIIGLVAGINIILALVGLILWVGVIGFAWVLGVFSPNIHTARLHYVEWMGKFYDGSGEVFAPFGPRQKHVEYE